MRIEQIVEGDGADIDTLMPISEHIIFDCKKISESQVFDNLSLLIKTNPMEHRSVYRNISHIVGSLEKGGRFVRKVVVADLTCTSERVRRYDLDVAVFIFFYHTPIIVIKRISHISVYISRDYIFPFYIFRCFFSVLNM